MTAEDRLRRLELQAEQAVQEIEFYKAILGFLRGLPSGSTVAEALAADEGQLIRRKWELKYGRKAPV